MKIRKMLAIFFLFLGLALPSFAQDTATQALTLTVSSGTLSFVTTNLPNGQVNLAYTGVSITVAGGVLPYTFSTSSGIPPGLALSTSGTFSGTPTAAGTFSFTVTVKDSEVPAVTNSQQFTINIQTGLTITTLSLPSANVGVAYSAQLAAAGGIAPYTWTISAGSLPTGLSLSSTGTFSGTPTAAGSFSFTVQVKDSASGTPAVVTRRATSVIRQKP